MKTETANYTSPTKRESEDAWIVNEETRVYGVFDGATPLTSFTDEQGHNGAFLASHIFKENFSAMTEKESLEEVTERANRALSAKMLEHNIDVQKGYECWTTCAAVIKLQKKTFEFVQLGDCMIVAGYRDGQVKVLTEDTVTGINERAKVRRQQDRKAGLEVPDESVFENRLAALRYNRSMANIENGYTVANGKEETLRFLQKGRERIKGVDGILILSDGLFHPDLSLKEVYQRIRKIGLHPYIKELTEKLRMNHLPIDDRTAVFIRL